MSVTAAIADAFKTNALTAYFSGTFKILLIKPGATGTYDKTLTNVGTPGTSSPSSSNVGTDEASGTGYTSGGQNLSGLAITLSTDTGVATWSNPVWTSSSISAIAAVIYKASTGEVVEILDLGGTITSTNASFTINFPTANASTGLIRVA